MAAGSQSDKLHSLQTENRHLKEMLGALRDELERRKIAHEEKCHAIEQTARDEAKQLHEIIRALRERLEGQDEKR